MFLEGFSLDVFRAKCNPRFQSVHCIAHLATDIREVLPYLNTVLGGHTYIEEPPSLTLKLNGKLITIYVREIAVNALHDEGEADRMLRWLQGQINETWERRAEISPTLETEPKPQILRILRLLPRTNCGRCGQNTCTVFAALMTEGAKGPEDCPVLDDENRKVLMDYLAQFHLLP